VKIKPGKYVQRDGGIATVVAVDETRSQGREVIGWAEGDCAALWQLDGKAFSFKESSHDLIREYREPREFWVVGCYIYTTPIAAKSVADDRGHEIIHVREVLEND